MKRLSFVLLLISACRSVLPRFDAIVVLSGGLTPESLPQPWVQARLDAAIPHLVSESTYLILNSRGTPHKPPGTIDESVASAKYVAEKYGVEPGRILLDSWSLDTIGNAYFALVNLVVPLQLKSVLVITSEFHMTRSAAIFTHVFSLVQTCSVEFLETDNRGLSSEALHARRRKEEASLGNFFTHVVPKTSTLANLTRFVFGEHAAYSFGGNPMMAPTDPQLLLSY